METASVGCRHAIPLSPDARHGCRAGLSPEASAAQQSPASPKPNAVPQPHVVRGTVTAAGGPVRGADVFLLESLDGATTDSAGHFSIRTTAAGSVTIVVRRIGYAPANLIVPVDTTGDVAFALSRQTATLAPITVQAGAYTAGNERGATLTALEVVTTPARPPTSHARSKRSPASRTSTKAPACSSAAAT